MGARLFTAILPPDVLVEELDHFLGPRRAAEPRLRWTRPGDAPDQVVNLVFLCHDRLGAKGGGGAERQA